MIINYVLDPALKHLPYVMYISLFQYSLIMENSHKMYLSVHYSYPFLNTSSLIQNVDSTSRE